MESIRLTDPKHWVFPAALVLGLFTLSGGGESPKPALPAPSIARFAQAPDSGESGPRLVAVFVNGSGRVDHGIGPVASGEAVPVSPEGDTVYTLRVTNAEGVWTEARVAVRAPEAASLTLDLSPVSGSWRVDGGDWMPSGSTVRGLAPGRHSLEYAPLQQYRAPAGESITLGAGEAPRLARVYEPTGGYYVHRLRFFIHQDLAGTLDAAALRSRLGQYAAHVQAVFHRETLRRLVFDPLSDITVCTGSPFTQGPGPYPETGFEVWVYARLTDRPERGSYGGCMAVDASGAGGADDLRWDRIYDPSALRPGSPQLAQYWLQIDHVLHELEHTFGAGVGEYYSAGGLQDPTGVEPVLPPMPGLNAAEGHPFWDGNQEYWADPLTVLAYRNPRLGSPDSLPALLAAVRFAPATVGVINGLHRAAGVDSVPDLSSVTVEVLDDVTGQPIPRASLRVWNRLDLRPQSNFFEHAVAPTAVPGVFAFEWKPCRDACMFNSSVNAKILKAYAPGYEPKAQWAWLYDAQREKCFYGRSEFKVTLRLTPLL